VNDVPAHLQKVTRSYMLHYPEHPARENDPHYRDFEHFRRTHVETARCAIGEHRDDYSECSSGDTSSGLELHHSHVEFALQNGVALAWLEKDYPGISDPALVGAWVESASNLLFLCEIHHRGHGGVHVTSASDYEASKYVRNLIS
jgi:hypothetical protein